MKTITEQLTEAGYSIESKLIRDDFDGIKGVHTHTVYLTKNDTTIEVEYTAGCGHRSYNGQAPKLPWGHNLTLHEQEWNRKTTPNDPTLADVMSCLVQDSSGVRHGQSFEDWCGDYGYDTDSRHAHKIFTATTDQWRDLVSLGPNFEWLETIFEDY